MTLIAGPVEQVLQHGKLNDEEREQLVLVERNTNRMLRLVNQILDFRKIQNKKMKMRVQQIDLIPFIRHIMESFNSLADEHQIDFSMDTKVSSLKIWADSDKLEKIFDNLLSNASKYTDPNGTLSIDIQCNTDEVVTIVTNTGAGIDKDKLPFIFDRFFTNDSYDKYSSGVGLSYVKSLVEVHGGTISADSQPGEYTRFTFSIPIRKDILQVKPRAITDYNLDVFSDNPALAATGAELPRPTVLKP